MPIKTLEIKLFPVFEPNEYLWEHHNKEDESKVDTYRRVVRDVMMKESGLKDGKDFSDLDRFRFIEAVTGKKAKE